MTSGEATAELRENFGPIGGEIRNELYRYLPEMPVRLLGFTKFFIEFTGSGRVGMGGFASASFR